MISEVTPGSAASDAGLEPGMLVQQVNRHKIRNSDELNDMIGKEKDGKSLLLLVSDGQNSRFVVLKAAE